jgi:hypothetical protein
MMEEARNAGMANGLIIPLAGAASMRQSLALFQITWMHQP